MIYQMGSVPIASDFPVRWDSQRDARFFWMLDKNHQQDPVFPLSFSISSSAFIRGFTKALKAYSLPIAEVRCIRINTYQYFTLVPVSASPLELRNRNRLAREKLMSTIPRLQELWNGEWLPEIKQHVAFWDAFDLRTASIPALIAHFDTSCQKLQRLWELHFRLDIPLYVALSLFENTYLTLFPDKTVLDSHSMLQGFENNMLGVMHGAWELAEKALRLPDVRRVLGRFTGPEIIVDLQRTREGKAFSKDLGDYLESYWKRADTQALNLIFFREDPTPAIEKIIDYMSRPARDPKVELEGLATERENLTGEVSQKLNDFPRKTRKNFMSLLKWGQTANRLLEEHDYWLEYGAFLRPDLVFLELGRRLVERGALQRREDVFYLARDEVKETAISQARINHRKLVAKRKAEMEHFRAISAPPVLGRMTSNRPPKDPIIKGLVNMFAHGWYWKHPKEHVLQIHRSPNG